MASGKWYSLKGFSMVSEHAAALMIANGIPVVIVAKILGHSKLGITMNVYPHGSVEMRSDAAKLMENLATPIPSTLKEKQKQEIPN